MTHTDLDHTLGNLREKDHVKLKAKAFLSRADNTRMVIKAHGLSIAPYRSSLHAPGRSLAPLLIGPSSAMAALWSQIRHTAPHFHMLLLTGEPGTGAEAVARVLHDLSPIADQPFHCLAAEDAEVALGIPATVLEGTLFLPEFDRLSAPAQAALLRLVQTGDPRNLRVVACTRTGIRALLSAGSLLPELASGFNAIRLRLPSLRDRSDDIPLLLDHLSQQRAIDSGIPQPTLRPDFLAAASAFPWPGNLEQMSEVLDWIAAHPSAPGEAPVAGAALLQEALAALAALNDRQPEPSPATRLVKLEQVVQEHIRNVLIACNGNKLRAAQILGISRSTLYRTLESSGAFSDIALAS